MKNKTIYMLILAFVLYSCKQKSTKGGFDRASVQKEVHQLTDASASSEGTFLFSDDNEIITNWTERGNKNEANILKFAFFNKKTESFSESMIVTPSKGLQINSESMAKVAATKTGVLYAFFRIKSKNSKSMYGGTLYYATSSDKGKNWSNKKKLVTDKKSTSQSFYDVEQLPDGELGLVWLDNRKLHPNNKGQTLYFAKTNANYGFHDEIALEGSVCQCCRTEIEVGENNEIHIGFRNIIEPNEIEFPDFINDSEDEIRDMYYITSTDNGVSFSKSIPISEDNWHIYGCPHTGPSLANNGDITGAIWFTAAHYSPGLYFSTINSTNFNERNLVSEEGRHPQMIAIEDIFFIVYEEYYEAEAKGYTRILLQERISNTIVRTKEISTPKTENNHAVLKQLNPNQILISWVNNDTRNSVIKYAIYNVTR